MIAKSGRGASFSGLSNYLLDGKLEKHKTQEKAANIICHSDNLRVPYDNLDKQGRKDMISDFNNQAKQKLGEPIKNPVGHHILSFNPKDSERLNADKLKEVTVEYIKNRGLSNTQYIAFEHHDTEHKHIHIAFNRVDNDGKVLDSNNYIDNSVVSHDLSKKHGLTQPNKQRLYVEKLERSDPDFRQNLGIRANQKIAEESKSVGTQVLKESNSSLNNARNMHHLSKLCENNGQKFEKSEDGKSIKIDNLQYQTSELASLFKRNRDLSVLKSKQDIEPRQRGAQEPDFKIKIDKQTQQLEQDQKSTLKEKAINDRQFKVEETIKNNQQNQDLNQSKGRSM